MGAWGPGPFDNDGAGDWCVWVEQQEPDQRAQFIAQTLADAADTAGWLDVDGGQQAVAAAAVVARLSPTGRSLTLIDVPDFVTDGYVGVDANLRALAVRALERVMAGDSELPGLWGGDEVFVATVDQLRAALAAAA